MADFLAAKRLLMLDYCFSKPPSPIKIGGTCRREWVASKPALGERAFAQGWVVQMPSSFVSQQSMSSKSKSSRSRSKSNRRQADPPAEPKLYVSGLSPDVQESDVREAFQKYGELTDVFLRPRDTFAFAFVTFTTSAAAQEALDAMMGQTIRGRRIRVEFAKPKRGREDGDAPRGGFGERGAYRGSGDRPRGCFKCGQEGHFARECTGEAGSGRYEGKGRSRRNRSGSSSRSASPKRKHTKRRSPSRSSSSPKKAKAHRKRSDSAGKRGKKEDKRSRSRSGERKRKTHKKRSDSRS